jgi:4-hydroxythreonine-4-phosphate dehydrogenase
VLEFLFMLTKDDATVADCLDVYEQVRDADLRWIGFKDVGVPVETIRELARRIRADGRSTVLEIVSIDEESEVRSAKAGIDLGVDLLMGGTHPESVLPLMLPSGTRYFPFPGRIVGHPSVLEGGLEEIADSARRMSSTTGIHGLDLLAYRWKGDVPALMKAVTEVSRGPVVVAGSIAGPARIAAVAKAGAWGFTIGGAVFDRELVPGGSIRDQIVRTLEIVSALG